MIGLDDRSVNLVGINSEGVITSTQNYGRHVFEGPASSLFKRRTVLGFCEGVVSLEFDVLWFGGDDE